MIGILPQTAPSYKSEVPNSSCNATSLSRCSAIIFLLAETTFFPLLRAFETISKAASASLINSIMVLIPGSFRITFASVVKSASGRLRFFSGFFIAIFLISILRSFVLMISCKPWPTTPNPNNPIVNLLLILLSYFMQTDHCFVSF